MTATESSTYDAAFFDRMTDGATRTARLVLPTLFEQLQPRSVLDIGCAQGAWLRVCRDLGATFIRGFDGDYVDRSRLLIDSTEYVAVDLNQNLTINDRFDLAICLEVVEHLEPARAEALIGVLVRAAPLVLFSAAIPGQGGVHHINERWPTYWRDVFGGFGYHRLDPFRRLFWGDARVDEWYQRNLVLFASTDAIAGSAYLQAESEFARRQPFELIDSRILANLDTVRGAWTCLRQAIRRAISRRLRRR
jgi:SAM-dependent methyltransferase